MEIERKFLVDSEKWSALVKPKPSILQQAYLSQAVDCTVRLRLKNDKAFLTIKGKTNNISRSEYEYEIPASEAETMMNEFCPKVLSKKRYELKVGQHLWEVDVFEGKLAPLIIAEIELSTEDETFEKPEWVTEEVSHLKEYYNSNLIERL